MTVFCLRQAERAAALLPHLVELTEHHRDRCPAYDRVLAAIGVPRGSRFDDVADLPWLPVRLFKTHDLVSVPREDVFKVLTSSGTTGSGASRIYLDRAAAAAQARHLAATLGAVLGNRRLPMLMVDSVAVVKNRRSFSARGAGHLRPRPRVRAGRA